MSDSGVFPFIAAERPTGGFLFYTISPILQRKGGGGMDADGSRKRSANDGLFMGAPLRIRGIFSHFAA